MKRYLFREELMRVFEKKIEKLQNAHDRQLTKLGDEVRRKIVIPACKKYNLTFASGMGSYSFYDKKALDMLSFVVDREDAKRLGYTLVVRAYNVLDSEVDSRGNLGVWVGDVKERK